MLSMGLLNSVSHIDLEQWEVMVSRTSRPGVVRLEIVGDDWWEGWIQFSHRHLPALRELIEVLLEGEDPHGE